MRTAGPVIKKAAIALTVLAGLVPGGSGSLSAAGGRRERRAAVSPAHRRPVSSRAAATPDILLTGATRETRAVEARLAGFVRAVRRRDGARAARYLSRETGPAMRSAVARREWPWQTAPQDLGPLFSQPRLQLRTLGLRNNRARVRIGPRQQNRYSLEAAGFYDLGMRREGARWQVTLPASAPAHSAIGRKP